MKPATLVFDNVTGLFDMAKGAQAGEITEGRETKGDWGLRWNTLMGQYADMIKLCRRCAEVQGMNVVLIGHIVGNYLNLGIDDKGNPQKKLIGWKVDVPGTGADELLVPFDEVYNLVVLPTATGGVPTRKLFTQVHEIEGYPFDAKSRKGVAGPLMQPTYAKIIAALPAGRDIPRKFLIVGRPGAGKTTLADTWPDKGESKEGIVYVDMMGGCEEVAKGKNRLLVVPQSMQELYKVMIKLSKSGEA